MFSKPFSHLLWCVKVLAVSLGLTGIAACSSDRNHPAADSTPAPSPFSKPVPHRLEGGKVQIELQKYVRYLELDQQRSGTQAGPCSVGEVDLFGAGTRYSPCGIGWVSPGEWVEYEVVDLPKGNYHIGARIASADAGLEAVISINGNEVGAAITRGGDWNSWSTELIKDIPLHGDAVVRVTFPTGNVNMSSLELIKDIGDVDVSFGWFEYSGKDAVFDEPLSAGEFQNPILAGFNPDPSVVRVGDDYYMVHSSYAWWPGLPVYQSTDLVNWRLLGHALTRRSQINLENRQISEGIFAPTIRYYDGIFYITSTASWAGGNFILTAEDPAGPWSDPVWLPDIGGIDPELFVDDDGKAYILHSDAPVDEPLYEGHRAIWVWEFDLDARSVIKGTGRVIVNGGVNLDDKPVWIEAPHIIKKDGWYYLTCSEGGNGYHHSEVVFRSKSMEGPFVPAERNPILTQRGLDINRANPVIGAGHADIVQTQTGEWWAVFLASRAYASTLINTGRETYLLPVQWKDGWPIILEPRKPIPYRVTKPSGLKPTKDARPMTGNFVWRDNFDIPELDLSWNTLRGPGTDWYRIDADVSNIVLTPSRNTLLQRTTPTFLARRQQHITYEARVAVNLDMTVGVSAGIAAFQNEGHHYYMGVKASEEGYILFVEKTESNVPTIIRSHNEKTLGKRLIMGIEGDAASISFFYNDFEGKRIYLGKDLNARILSTQVAGGFVGTFLGIHARHEP